MGKIGPAHAVFRAFPEWEGAKLLAPLARRKWLTMAGELSRILPDAALLFTAIAARFQAIKCDREFAHADSGRMPDCNSATAPRGGQLISDFTPPPLIAWRAFTCGVRVPQTRIASTEGTSAFQREM